MAIDYNETTKRARYIFDIVGKPISGRTSATNIKSVRGVTVRLRVVRKKFGFFARMQRLDVGLFLQAGDFRELFVAKTCRSLSAFVWYKSIYCGLIHFENIVSCFTYLHCVVT